MAKWVFLILLSFTLLSGCAFHPRRSTDIPPQLRTLYLDTTQPYNKFILQLKNMLQSLNIKLSKTPYQTPYRLNIFLIHFTQENPNITTTNLAVTITYHLRVGFQLQSRSGKTIIPSRVLVSTRSISQNPIQVYTPGAGVLAKQELQRDILSQIYYLLTTNDTRDALNHAH